MSVRVQQLLAITNTVISVNSQGRQTICGQSELKTKIFIRTIAFNLFVV